MTKLLERGYAEIATLPPGTQKALEYAVCGLLTEDAHHKQWCLERVLEALGADLEKFRAHLQAQGYDWEDGIAP